LKGARGRWRPDPLHRPVRGVPGRCRQARRGRAGEAPLPRAPLGVGPVAGARAPGSDAAPPASGPPLARRSDGCRQRPSAALARRGRRGRGVVQGARSGSRSSALAAAPPAWLAARHAKMRSPFATNKSGAEEWLLRAPRSFTPIAGMPRRWLRDAACVPEPEDAAGRRGASAGRGTAGPGARAPGARR